jgi:hypothetical protein
MLRSDEPTKIQTAFAASGARNVLGNTSLIGTTDGAASFPDGFPPLTMTDPSAGGLFPDGRDFNGAFYALSAVQRWQEAGGLPMYDSAFSTAVGGYPLSAVLQAADGTGFWVSQTNSNTNNPDTGGANWLPILFIGSASQAMAGANVTLTALQASKPIIFVTGTLSANVNLVLPAQTKQWLVVNNTSGAFALSAKTASGTAVLVRAGTNFMYGDGTNILSANASGWATGGTSTLSVGSAAAATNTVGSSGWERKPNGRGRQWATVQCYDDAGTTVCTWNFPNATLFASGVETIRCLNLGSLAGQAGAAHGGVISLLSHSATGITFYGHSTNVSGTKFWALIEVEGI